MHHNLSGSLFLIDSVYTLAALVISISIYSKLNDYYQLTAYESLKYFKNSFITLVFSFLIIYVLKIIELFETVHLFFKHFIMFRSELFLHDLLTISVLLFLYYYLMSFLVDEINEKNITLYNILRNEKIIFLFIIIFGIVLTPEINRIVILMPFVSLYLIYRKMKINQKRPKYFVIYNLLILLYAINLLQLVLFSARHYCFIDIACYFLQIYIYVKILNEVKN
jgi:hypothetical protein